MTFDAVFDMDGTLVDSAGQCEAIIDAMRADRGLDRPVPIALCRQYAGIKGEVMVPALLGEAARDPVADVAEFRDRYAAMKTTPDALYPGVIDGLERLRDANIRLTICSAKPHRLVERVTEDTGLARFFAGMLGGDRGACKPDPAHYDATLALVGGTRARSLLVGDSVSDHRLAANASVTFLFVTYGYSRPEEELSGDIEAGDFATAVAAIKRLAG
ncbi:HAD family hydrolase [Sphingomicrobium clamense]|uniref:HAD hydrolase-like protein n=1 Tax=Sphingomicrobium clamense TaxID=2851013 RepID=A0ABS6V356_9SPHN|nr:HAD family hydrolase [Sphingomicrobium sp. B8]MBW0143971.1 HAD hydrolase-like protein [Sphingomicrobium sp. B8]